MLVAHWGKERLRDRPINLVLTLFILVLVILLLIARVALVTTFAFRRPVVYPEGIQREVNTLLSGRILVTMELQIDKLISKNWDS